ncbi:uncharacterized protein BDZ99DRAFT_517825 [Mytilinidion resinicola]|uniref:F-box domain-containing protein n=1 Tax=Mytilinidion resinicola TaxID=574789 RepID=A0A6A6YYK6_9PEZI|nr:uncharacterized protein BDZ99DRAFT_517825 [Mytilinidion resinicola]KAF2813579.1 hypothetical protein BDZ99DRAFT_517825 [Mytilinidion resinicola]
MADSANAVAVDAMIENEHENETGNEIETRNENENENEAENENEPEIENEKESAATDPPRAPTPPPPDAPSQPDLNYLSNTEQVDLLTTSPKYKSMAKLHALLTRTTLGPSASDAPSPEAGPAARLRLHVAAAQARLQQIIAQEKAAKMELTPEQRKEVFPFLALPAELRVLVYEELLVTDDRLLVTWRGPKRARVQQKKMWTSVLRVNRLVSGEAREVLYGGNVFDFEEIMLKFSTGSSFLTAIGRHNARLIRTLVADVSATRELRAASPLRSRSVTYRALDTKHNYHINAPFLATFLASWGISFRHLRLLAVHLQHMGKDWYDSDWVEPVYRGGARSLEEEEEERAQERMALKRREEVEKAVEVVREREGGWLKLVREEEARGLEGEWERVGGRWFVYKGVRRGEGEEDEEIEVIEEGKGKGKEKENAVEGDGAEAAAETDARGVSGNGDGESVKQDAAWVLPRPRRYWH